jgi:hypothetical protein
MGCKFTKKGRFAQKNRILNGRFAFELSVKYAKFPVRLINRICRK